MNTAFDALSLLNSVEFPLKTTFEVIPYFSSSSISAALRTIALARSSMAANIKWILFAVVRAS